MGEHLHRFGLGGWEVLAHVLAGANGKLLECLVLPHALPLAAHTFHLVPLALGILEPIGGPLREQPVLNLGGEEQVPDVGSHADAHLLQLFVFRAGDLATLAGATVFVQLVHQRLAQAVVHHLRDNLVPRSLKHRWSLEQLIEADLPDVLPPDIDDHLPDHLARSIASDVLFHVLAVEAEGRQLILCAFSG
jgi:hypothetical protein